MKKLKSGTRHTNRDKLFKHMYIVLFIVFFMGSIIILYHLTETIYLTQEEKDKCLSIADSAWYGGIKENPYYKTENVIVIIDEHTVSIQYKSKKSEGISEYKESVLVKYNNNMRQEKYIVNTTGYRWTLNISAGFSCGIFLTVVIYAFTEIVKGILNYRKKDKHKLKLED